MPELYKEDQNRVNEFIQTGVNNMERAPFRPWRLLAVIMSIMVLFTLISYLIAHFHGVV